MNQSSLEEVRRAALGRIEKSRNTAKRFLIGAAVFETVMVIAVLLTMQVSNRTHLLIFFCTCLIYGPLALGLFALRAYIDLSTQRVLRAVELHGDAQAEGDS